VAHTTPFSFVLPLDSVQLDATQSGEDNLSLLGIPAVFSPLRFVSDPVSRVSRPRFRFRTTEEFDDKTYRMEKTLRRLSALCRAAPGAAMTRFCVFSLIALLVSSILAAGQAGYQVLYSFGTNSNDGITPNGDLVFDDAGNIYGTTPLGGSVCNSECGAAFELSPSSGSWMETIIYNFGNDSDGASPRAGLIFDGSGNLYGTTFYGGTHGAGVVFELSPPPAGGTWIETVLWNFGGAGDGGNPNGKLTWDASGNLYGTTAGLGTVFELSPASGGWTEKVLYHFCPAYPDCSDGAEPMAGVTFDNAGNLYGTTYFGGASHGFGPGVVYELSPASGGGWTETTLYRFSTKSGYQPLSEVSFDKAGNLYGTVYQGARYGCGGVFQMIPNDGIWIPKGIQPFKSNIACSPEAGLFIDNRSNSAFGTSQYGGAFNGGAAFEITTRAVTTIHSFCSESTCQDGTQPAGVLALNAGKLYGTTTEGGASSACGQLGCGVVFQLAP
jgi:uncharacterized repeat protein (TIGR03803 family)